MFRKHAGLPFQKVPIWHELKQVVHVCTVFQMKRLKITFLLFLLVKFEPFRLHVCVRELDFYIQPSLPYMKKLLLNVNNGCH